jgi:hypothetical protein
VFDFTGENSTAILNIIRGNGPRTINTIKHQFFRYRNGIRASSTRANWAIDDIPTPLKTKFGDMISVSYGLDLTDSVIYAIEKLSMLEMKLRIEQIRDCHAKSAGLLIWAVPDWH